MFKERQKFDQWWLLGMFYAGLGFCIYATVQQLIYGIPLGNNPAPDGFLIGFIFFFLILFGAFKITTLITEIDDQQIRFRFYPFQKKFEIISKEDITSLSVITYRPIADFGGWGVRMGRKGLAYNVSGNEGLYIFKKSGKKILLGTSQPDEMEEFLKTHGWLENEKVE